MKPNYFSYRQRLLAQIHGTFWKHKALPIGNDLFIDIIYSQNETNKALIHISGTHGAEGFIGSDIQHKLLTQIKEPPKINVIFIHALNPYGMSRFQRTNKNNVDLNRNFFTDYQKLPNNENFDRYVGILNAKSRFFFFLNIFLQMPTLLKHGLEPLSRTIALGQNHRPESVFYGGREMQKELVLVLQFLKENFSRLKEVVTLDVHSGLGSYMQESLILDGSLTSGEKEFFEQVLLSDVIDPNSARGFYRCDGLLSFAFKNLWVDRKVHSIYQEFGTAGLLSSFWALISRDPKLMLENYYPDDEKWQTHCLELGLKRAHALINLL